MPQRLETAKQKLAAVQEADYLKSLVGTLGADPLTAARAHAEEPVVIWGKASLSPKISKGVVMQGAEHMPVYEVPSLLQRVKSKLKRARLN
jgi:hypothetical protein